MDEEPIRGQVVLARDIRVGDRVYLKMLGARRVTRVETGEIGMTGRPCVRVTYAVGPGGGVSYENKAQSHGPSSSSQVEAGLRPFPPDELVTIVLRPENMPDLDKVMAWRVMAGDVLYASRETHEEALQVIEEQRHLCEMFGIPRVERAVIQLADHRRR